MILKEYLRRIYYYKSFSKFKKYGQNMRFGKRGVFLRPEDIEFGNNVFIGRNFHISARNLTFGSNIMIGPNLVIECDNHIFNKVGEIMFEGRKERKIGKTIIENDVWIGANVIILPNVKISEGSVIGAGSVVTKSIAPYTIAVGNPAKPIKRRFDSESLKKHLEKVDSIYSSSDIISIWENETGK